MSAYSTLACHTFLWLGPEPGCRTDNDCPDIRTCNVSGSCVCPDGYFLDSDACISMYSFILYTFLYTWQIRIQIKESAGEIITNNSRSNKTIQCTWHKDTFHRHMNITSIGDTTNSRKRKGDSWCSTSSLCLVGSSWSIYTCCYICRFAQCDLAKTVHQRRL